jgi:hypothetical protein
LVTLRQWRNSNQSHRAWHRYGMRVWIQNTSALKMATLTKGWRFTLTIRSGYQLLNLVTSFHCISSILTLPLCSEMTSHKMLAIFKTQKQTHYLTARLLPSFRCVSKIPIYCNVLGNSIQKFQSSCQRCRPATTLIVFYHVICVHSHNASTLTLTWQHNCCMPRCKKLSARCVEGLWRTAMRLPGTPFTL